MGSAIIFEPGFYCSIQDLGRLHYRHVGVPHAGSMDRERASLANQLVRNSLDAAVLEMILRGATLQFREPCVVGITGNLDRIHLNDELVSSNQAYQIKTGDGLKIGRVISGNFAYLSIAAGWQTEKVLGSRSMYSGITQIGRCQKGTELAYQARSADFLEVPSPDPKAEQEIFMPEKETRRIRVVQGPEYHLLPPEVKDLLSQQAFSLSPSWNRMAYKFETGYTIQLPQIKTAPVLPGTVQLTPSGSLIVLMRDAQTTGGYPRVLQVDEDHMNQLVRTGVGDQIRFEVC
jgi:biotin-dependent carboxylase-like uncharacterized protein